nr:hypothetical protein [Tanacetum cinerariifolium]
MEAEEVTEEEEESESETDEEVEEILEEEEEDKDDEKFNSFPTMKELSHHEWLIKNPRPSWIPLALLIAASERWYLEGLSLMKPASNTIKKKERSCLSKIMRKSNLKSLTPLKNSSKQDLWLQVPIPYPRSPMKKTLAMEGRTIIKAYSLGMSTGNTKEIGEGLGI